MGITIGLPPVPRSRLGALATANGSETGAGNVSQSKSDPSPKVNFARLFCETDGFRFGFEDWEFDSGMDEGGRPESTFGDGDLGGCEIDWRARSGGDVDESFGCELDGRGGNGGELREDGVRSGGELDGGEFSEDGVKGGGELDGGEFSEDGVRSGGELDGGELSEDGIRSGDDLDGSGGDGSRGAISGTINFNSDSVLRRV